MINGQKKALEFCDLIFENAKTANVEDIQQKVTSLKEMAQNQELIVPVVGAFSAGKSTLINKIIGNDILPVAITPETSLATELNYAVEEYIEAIKNDGTIERYTVNELTIERAAKLNYILQTPEFCSHKCFQNTFRAGKQLKTKVLQLPQ
ncbi:MAG: hypothetical protein Ta2B_30520 [Termitinemataceae bacterium]|nr:MAG: hypothetical protein Ta2B_30520 [Termitinemataceae bacterium]